MTYQVLKEFFPREKIIYVREMMLKQHAHREKIAARSGFTLTHEGWLFDILAPLAQNASETYGQFFVLRPDWSSCQLVEPQAGLEFPPHQDIAALEIKSAADKGCVFWIPLDDITPFMPTLAISPSEYPMLPHKDDGRGLSIIDGEQIWLWVTLNGLRIGDVVRMDALTVHMTHVPENCTQPRLSLDVRAKPQ